MIGKEAGLVQGFCIIGMFLLGMALLFATAAGVIYSLVFAVLFIRETEWLHVLEALGCGVLAIALGYGISKPYIWIVRKPYFEGPK